MRLFAAWKFAKLEAGWHYYVFPLYAHLAKKRGKTKTYGDKLMQVTAITFYNYVNELPEMFMNKDANRQNMWSVSTSFRTLYSIGDANYM